MPEVDDHAIESELAQLGTRLAEMRSKRGWTLEEVSERSGLSKAYLSRLEGGSRQPSIAAVLTLARVFDVPMASLFGSQRKDEPCIVVRGGAVPTREGDGIKYTPLSIGSQFNLEPIRLVVSAWRRGNERFQHEGEEWLFVLSGKLRLLLGDREYAIDAGDAAHFDARLPHRLEAMGGTDADIILVASPIPIATTRRPEPTAATAGLIG
ncbi:MAG: XRE family transcriptional regulator [Tepidisphaeraceae bacterium]|jgi:transcriptional regulator with XRE-family HTH domain